jgi:hypothetical protein
MSNMFPINPALGQIAIVRKVAYRWNGVIWVKHIDVTSNTVNSSNIS